MSTKQATIRKAVMSLTQGFYFEAAHTLERAVGADASRRIHGHTYDAEVMVSVGRKARGDSCTLIVD